MPDVTEAELFAVTLRGFRKAFDKRQPDARDRVTAMRDRYLVQAGRLNQQARVARAAKMKAADYKVFGAQIGLGVVDPCVFPIANPDDLIAAASNLWDKAAALNDLLLEFKNANLEHAGEEQATPETLIKLQPVSDGMARLFKHEHITSDQLRAARNISTIYEALVRGLMASVSRFEGGGGRKTTFGGLTLPEYLADAHAAVYLPWTRFVERHKNGNLPLVIDIAVDGLSMDAARRRRKLGWKKALGQLTLGLDDFGQRWDHFQRQQDEVRL